MAYKFAEFERTPPEVVEAIRDVIEGRVVYDLGAGDGLFASALKVYAGRVVAVEGDKELVAKCRKRGVTTISNDFMDVDWRDADVLYTFLSFIGQYNVTRKIEADEWSGTLVSMLYPAHTWIGDMYKPHDVRHIKVGGENYAPILMYQFERGSLVNS